MRSQERKQPIRLKTKRMERSSGEEAEKLKEEIFREWVNFESINVAEHLSEKWGIENLSTIEGVRLRQIVEAGMKQRQKELALLSKKEISVKGNDTDWLLQRTVEYTARWLNELYNIRDIDVTDRTGKISEEIKEYIRRLRDKAHKP